MGRSKVVKVRAFHPLPGFAGTPPPSGGETTLCRSRLMSLGETIPTSRPPSITRVRPSLQPASERPSRLVTGSAGPALDTLASGDISSLMRVVVRASGATFLSAATPGDQGGDDQEAPIQPHVDAGDSA